MSRWTYHRGKSGEQAPVNLRLRLRPKARNGWRKVELIELMHDAPEVVHWVRRVRGVAAVQALIDTCCPIIVEEDIGPVPDPVPDPVPVEVCQDCAYVLLGGECDDSYGGMVDDLWPPAFDGLSAEYDPEHSYCGCGRECDDLTACPSLGQDGGFGTAQCDRCRTALAGDRYNLLVYGYQEPLLA